MTKTCTGCGRELPATTEFFYAGRRYAGGLRSECRDCKRAREVDRVDELREYRRLYYAENQERRCAESRAYAAAHSEEKRDYNRRYRVENADKIRAQREARSVERREYSNLYRLAHLEEFRAYQHSVRAKRRNAPGTHTADDVAQQYLRQHGRCYWCGERVGKDYHVDHVVPLARGGSNGPENLVIACPPCNMRKHAKLPHEFSDRLC